MLQFSVYNPQDDEEMQKTLGAKGIRPFQVQSIEKDEMGIKLIWSAMTIAYKDKPEEVLPQVLPQSLASLEQDVIGPDLPPDAREGAEGGGVRPEARKSTGSWR